MHTQIGSDGRRFTSRRRSHSFHLVMSHVLSLEPMYYATRRIVFYSCIYFMDMTVGCT